MKTRLGAFLFVGLAVITLANGCNGANDITGPQNPREGGAPSPPPQTVTPHPQVTPDIPCGPKPNSCF